MLKVTITNFEHWWIFKQTLLSHGNIVKSHVYNHNLACVNSSLSNLGMASTRDSLSRNAAGSNTSSL